jgi:hypothetical protein
MDLPPISDNECEIKEFPSEPGTIIYTFNKTSTRASESFFDDAHQNIYGFKTTIENPAEEATPENTVEVASNRANPLRRANSKSVDRIRTQ